MREFQDRDQAVDYAESFPVAYLYTLREVPKDLPRTVALYVVTEEPGFSKTNPEYKRISRPSDHIWYEGGPLDFGISHPDSYGAGY